MGINIECCPERSLRRLQIAAGLPGAMILMYRAELNIVRSFS